MSQIVLHSSTKQLGTFPLKLYDMLEDAEKHGFDDIISWTPDGTGFKVHRPNDLVEQILPLYFDQQTRYKSFQRQLNMYEFKMLRKATKGTYEEHLKGAFFHPFFVRGKRESSAIIPRKSCSRANDHTPPYFRGRFVILTALPEYHNEGANHNNMGDSFQQKWRYYHPVLGSTISSRSTTIIGGTSPNIVDTSSMLPFYGYPSNHTLPSSMDGVSTVHRGERKSVLISSNTTPGMISCDDFDVYIDAKKEQKQTGYNLDRCLESNYYITREQPSKGSLLPNAWCDSSILADEYRGNNFPDSSRKDNDLFSSSKNVKETFFEFSENPCLPYPKTTSTLTEHLNDATPDVNTFTDTEDGVFSCSAKLPQQMNDLPIIFPSLNSQASHDNMIFPDDVSIQDSKFHKGERAHEFDNNDTNRPNLSDSWQSWPWYKEHEDELLDYAKQIISSSNNPRLMSEVNNLDGSETKGFGSSGIREWFSSGDTNTNLRNHDYDAIEDINSTFSILGTHG